MHKRGGFTLAELLIVVAVIAVLVAVAIPTFGNQLEKSRQGVDLSNLRGAYAAGKLAVINQRDKSGNILAGNRGINLAAVYEVDEGTLTLAKAEDDISDYVSGKAMTKKVVIDTTQLPDHILYTDKLMSTQDKAIVVSFIWNDSKYEYELGTVQFNSKAVSLAKALQTVTLETAGTAPTTIGTPTAEAAVAIPMSDNYTIDIQSLFSFEYSDGVAAETVKIATPTPTIAPAAGSPTTPLELEILTEGEGESATNGSTIKFTNAKTATPGDYVLTLNVESSTAGNATYYATVQVTVTVSKTAYAALAAKATNLDWKHTSGAIAKTNGKITFNGVPDNVTDGTTPYEYSVTASGTGYSFTIDKGTGLLTFTNTSSAAITPGNSDNKKEATVTVKDAKGDAVTFKVTLNIKTDS